MDPPNSGDSSISTPVTQRSTELTVEVYKKNVLKPRQSTDKPWSIIFVVIFIFWIVSWHYVVLHEIDDHNPARVNTAINYVFEYVHDKKDYASLSNASLDAHNISTFFGHKVDSKADLDFFISREKNIRSAAVSLYTLIAVYTCNPSNLSNPPEGLDIEFLLFGHVLFAIMYFVFPLVHVRNNKLFCKQPSIVGAAFILVALLEHLSVLICTRYSIAFSILRTHERLVYWMMPEAVFLIVWSSKMFSAGYFRKNDDNVSDANCDNDSGHGSDNDSDDDNEIEKSHLAKDIIPFSTYVPAIIFGIPIIMILKVLIMCTMTAMYEVGWRSKHFYIIAGGSFYVGRTIYYFALMVTSCATTIARKSKSPSILQSALSVVARYHFGTACYHAMLILPKWRAKSVFTEPTFKPIRKEEKRERKENLERIKRGERITRIPKKELRVKHNELFKLSRTTTAVYGTGHSESIRNLLRLYSKDFITKKSFENFGSISKHFFLLLIATNCLLIIVLWSNGKVDDSLALATWIMYLKIAFLFSLAMAFVTSTLDAVKLSAMQSVLANFSDEDLCKGVVVRSDSHHSSDDEDSV